MELTSEETVTKLLSANEILHVSGNKLFSSNPLYDLGEFLENIKNTPSPYAGKYIFIK